MLDRKEDFRLVMALAEWAYQAKHIPGSIHFATMRDALHSLNKEDEIVVYCSDAGCIASTAFGQLLERNGYTHVLHFAGGLQEWEQAGYPLVLQSHLMEKGDKMDAGVKANEDRRKDRTSRQPGGGGAEHHQPGSAGAG